MVTGVTGGPTRGCANATTMSMPAAIANAADTMTRDRLALNT
jgi:hypothetical protein